MAAVTLILLSLFTCGLFFWFVSSTRRGKSPPLYPGAWPIVGHLPIFLELRDCKEIWGLWYNAAKECWNNGGITEINMSCVGLRHFIIGDPEDFLTVANNTKHYLYKILKPLGTNSLVISEGKIWQQSRKQIQPAFSSRFLHDLLSVFNNCGKALSETWASEVGRPFEILQTLGETSLLAVIGDIAKEYNVSIKNYVEAVAIVDRGIALRVTNVIFHSDFIFFLTKDGREQIKAAEYVKREGKKIINAIKDSVQKNKNGPKTVIEYLVESAGFDDDYLLGEVTTMLVAGHTTTASSLTSLFLLLGSYPDVQEKLYNELTEVLGTSNRDVTAEDLSRLPYLDAVVKEGLRKYPAVPVTLRQCDKELVLKNYTMPANSYYVLHLYAANHHPMWGADRMEFRPERWLEPEKLPLQHAFATFGAGKRTCIGKNYAKVSMKVMVAHIIRRYRVFADVSKLEIKLEFMMKPAAGGDIRLEERNSKK